MNEQQQIEKTLASWTPRKPSPRVRRSLFGLIQPEVEGPETFRWSWLTPATAALMLAFMGLDQESPRLPSLSRDLEASITLAEPGLSTYLAPLSLHNALALRSPANFASTTHSSSPSTQAPRLMGTNALRP
ncbi:MAG: hypothetical protein FJ405_08000 [Verrucomicrobia bacterium]|nr:hypothetical protein [Verrucomicrobiota bacterium]